MFPEEMQRQRKQRRSEWADVIEDIDLSPIRKAMTFFDERAEIIAEDVGPQAAAVATVASLREINRASYEALKRAVVEAIALGTPVVTAAEYAGITRVTAATWRDEAQGKRPQGQQVESLPLDS